MEIPTGELLADLQAALVEVFLIDCLCERGQKYKTRRAENVEVAAIIMRLLVQRFTISEIELFLTDGYPRSVSVNKICRDSAITNESRQKGEPKS